jgi:hypothetical protein
MKTHYAEFQVQGEDLRQLQEYMELARNTVMLWDGLAVEARRPGFLDAATLEKARTMYGMSLKLMVTVGAELDNKFTGMAVQVASKEVV